MIKKILWPLGVLITAMIVYFTMWPVSINPVSWTAPPNPGYSGPYEINRRLKGIETFPLAGHHGPEDIAIDSKGRIYAATHEGIIVRLDPDGSNPINWVNTNGRPLGIDFDRWGHLIVADAFRGLLSITPKGEISELATVADGIPIRYANDKVKIKKLNNLCCYLLQRCYHSVIQ